jgi:hypothetical protein
MNSTRKQNVNGNWSFQAHPALAGALEGVGSYSGQGFPKRSHYINVKNSV